MSLRYKFILAFMVFTVVVSVAFGIVAIQRLSDRLRGQYERHAIQLAAHAAEEVLESQVLGVGHDPLLIARNILIEDVIYAQIVLDGVEITRQARYPVDLPLVPLSEVIELNEVSPANAAPYFDVIYPLRDAWDTLTQFGHLITPEGQKRLQQGIHGYVRLGVSLERMGQELRRETLLVAGVSLGLMALGILVGWGLYRMILGPIERLGAAVREFGAGNTRVRAQVNSGDEIEALAHDFNTMAHSIVYQRDALRRTNEELERANRVKSVFLATLSHELLTPLHSVLGYVSLLLDGVNVKLSSSGRQYAEAIQRAGKHLLALIENLLQFSKLEAGSERLHLTEVEAAEIVKEVVESQRPLVAEKGLRLEVEVEPGLKLHTDVTKLKQVLLNLLNNAIKYTAEGHIGVTARSQNDSVRFEVRDTGPGIAPEARATLFEPFMRAGKPDQPSDGMGLGLAVARRYVELLGGTISFESRLGEGSRFWFTLPKEVQLTDEAAHR